MGPTSKLTMLDRTSIEEMVDNGATIVIYNYIVLNLSSWLKNHPGGDKTILHMVGRDATDQINAFHSKEIRTSMQRYQIGTIDKRRKWENLVPPIQRPCEGKNILELGYGFETQDRRETRGNKDAEEVASESSSRSSSVFDISRRRRRRSGSGSSISSIRESDDEIIPERVVKETSRENVTVSEETDRDEDETVASFRDLVDQLEAKGLYKCNYWAYLTEGARITSLGAVMLLLLRWEQYFLSAVALGLFWHQLVFTSHDAGHLGITHNYQIDTLIGIIPSSILGGLSLSWWKTAHNVHHLATNSPSHDPDIQHLPFMAITPAFFSSLYSTYFGRIMPYTEFSKILMSKQHWMYYPLLCFGRFNLYALSWEHLWADRGPKHRKMWWHRPSEAAGQLMFWYWFGYKVVYQSLPTWPLRIMFVLVSHAVTMPLHVQFTLSHFAMTVSGENEKDENWPTQQLRTTMDVDCPPWMDWFHGGLQFQAIHHLFPRLPRHNLRQASEFVKVWAKDVGLKYEVYGFVECNGRVLSRLEEVGRQARFLKDAHRAVVDKGEWMHGEWE